MRGFAGLWRALGMEHELDDPGAVAQVDEDQPAVVAPAVHPAGNSRARACALGGQLPAPGVAIGVRSRSVLHVNLLARRIIGITFSAAVSRCTPDSMSLSDTGALDPLATIAT